MKALLAALLFLALAAPAQASFTVTPSTTQAGAHADASETGSYCGRVH